MSLPIKYLRIRDKVINSSCESQHLLTIKNLFEPQIDSKRRFDLIQNIRDLVRILEKRDILSSEDVSPLLQIALALNRHDLVYMVTNYSQRDDELPNLISPINHDRINPQGVIPAIEEEPVQRVYNLICADIGQKWKDLARILKVKEGYIDSLEITHKRIPEMVREVLIFHKDNSDPNYWKINLCKGLEKARRADLSQQVQEVFAMNGLM